VRLLARDEGLAAFDLPVLPLFISTLVNEVLVLVVGDLKPVDEECLLGRIEGCDVDDDGAQVLGSGHKNHSGRDDHRCMEEELPVVLGVGSPDPRFVGHDAATAVELIEHLDSMRLSAFERVIFFYIRPTLFVVTTPNAEYNVSLGLTDVASRRHPDHRFEWTRDQFRAWISHAADRAGYTCAFRAIGVGRFYTGAPTQMAICTRSRHQAVAAAPCYRGPQ
jgi:hypothetical protein